MLCPARVEHNARRGNDQWSKTNRAPRGKEPPSLSVCVVDVDVQVGWYLKYLGLILVSRSQRKIGLSLAVGYDDDETIEYTLVLNGVAEYGQ